MWFDRWYDLIRVVLVGPAAYVVLIVFLRVSGKRTLAKLNAFDFVVTVALGSTLATILLSGDVAYLEGAVGLAVLIVLQYAVARASVAIPFVRRAVKSEPRVVVRHGEVRHDALRRERLTIEEIHQALRQSGVADVRQVAAVVLETDGSLSVVGDAGPDASALADVAGWVDGPPAAGGQPR
jgi:uncharacterized membrane protein YcaP (DUF421 family)